MRKVRAILIDPFACEITEIEHEADDYKNIYATLSHETMPVSCFDVLRLDDGDAVFIDDEGAMKHAQRAIICRRFPGRPAWPLFGKGLVLGSDANGDTASCKISIEKVRNHFTFGQVVYDEHGDVKTIYHTPTTPWVDGAKLTEFLSPEAMEELRKGS